MTTAYVYLISTYYSVILSLIIVVWIMNIIKVIIVGVVRDRMLKLLKNCLVCVGIMFKFPGKLYSCFTAICLNSLK